MIKKLNSFADDQEQKWEITGILGAILSGVIAVIAIISHPIHIPTIIIGVAGVVVIPTYCSIRAGKAKDKSEAIYKQYLNEIPLETLIKASSSPEVDLDSSRIIVSYLNENHPGWSFN